MFYGARRTSNGKIQIMRSNQHTQGNLEFFATNDLGDATFATEVLNGFDCRKEHWFQAAQLRKSETFIQMYKRPIFNDLIITVALPYFYQGKFAGVFGADIPRKLDEIVKRLPHHCLNLLC